MPFSESFLTELAERNDIADVVGGYVNLSKRSGQNMFGLCPFHNEKTASFSVNPSRQMYHCFGCGKGGGVINFIMEIEQLSFPEAVEFLAKRAGMKMPESDYDPDTTKKAALLQLNKDAARFFYDCLKAPSGETARAYIESRSLSKATVTNFGLGFAPDSWDSLRNAMRSKGYSDSELFAAGLVKKGKNGGFYDAFRNRLIFPVIDVRGNVIGFSGRALSGDGAKYINSPETAVYNKGRNLFGLNLAKKSKADYIILVEGNVDVVMLHQAGFDSAVASLGTSLTNEQARLISRFKNQVILAYDSDEAGQKASRRAIDILQHLDVKTKVLRLDGAKDPDEYIKLKGAAAFRNLIERSEVQTDYRLRSIQDKYSLEDAAQKIEFIKEASLLVAGFPNQVERQVYSSKIAEIAAVPSDVIAKEVEQQRRKLLGRAEKADRQRVMRVDASSQPADTAIRYDDTASAKAEEGIIRLIYRDPELASSLTLSPEDFTSPALGHILSVLLSHTASGGSVNVSVLSGELGAEEMNLFSKIIQDPEKLSCGAETLKDYISKIQDQKKLAAPSNNLLELQKSLIEKGKGYK